MNEKSLNSIRKIVTHAQKAVDYASSTPIWWEDDKCLDAIVFNLAQIGELVRFVEDEIQAKSPQVNWPAMKGFEIESSMIMIMSNHWSSSLSC